MNMYKTGLLRLGAYLLLGGMLTVPVSCDRERDSALKPSGSVNRGARTDQAGCGGFTNGKFLGTWTATGSRLQVLINGNQQYVAQIFGDNEFYIRGKAFLNRTDIANKQYDPSQVDCFEGDAGDAQGFSVSNFQVPVGFEAGPSPNSYRVSCSPRFRPNANSGDRTIIAFWTATNDRIEGRYFRGQWWIVQNVSRFFFKDAFIIRGRNMLIRSDVQGFDDPWDIGRRYCIGGGDTGTNGLESPSNSPFELVPEGYTKGTFPDGSPYFVQN